MANGCCVDNNCGIDVRVLCLSQVEGLMAVDVTGIRATIEIEVPGGGMYWYRAWLSDSATDPTETLYKPTTGTTTRWEGVTNTSGQTTIIFENSNSSRTWYLWSIFVKVNVSDAITVGV